MANYKNISITTPNEILLVIPTAEEILRKTTDSVRDQQWDIKDLQREVLGD